MSFCANCGISNPDEAAFCSSCGKATSGSVPAEGAPPAANIQGVTTAAPAVPRAPTPPAKQVDEIFCQSCGSVIKKEADICIHCGVRVRRGSPSGGGGSKSKVASILLAVFLSYWTWLYTYREDAVKFWVSLGLSIGFFIFGLLTLGIGWLIGFFVWTGIWIWAIVDTATKNEDWYATY